MPGLKVLLYAQYTNDRYIKHEMKGEIEQINNQWAILISILIYILFIYIIYINSGTQKMLAHGETRTDAICMFNTLSAYVNSVCSNKMCTHFTSIQLIISL